MEIGELGLLDNKDYTKDAAEVFNRVKRGFTYVSDETQYGVAEDWRFPEDFDNVVGDCDDFAIAASMDATDTLAIRFLVTALVRSLAVPPLSGRHAMALTKGVGEYA